MAKLHPYLHFENALEALTYYVDVFGARIIDRYPVPAEMAAHFGIAPDNLEQATMHAEFMVEGTRVLCSDRMGSVGEFSPMMGLLLDFDMEVDGEVEKMHALWQRILDSGTATVQMPLAQQFWGGWMGNLVDKFGITWMIHAQPFSKIIP